MKATAWGLRRVWWLTGCVMLTSVGCAWKADLDKSKALNSQLQAQLTDRAEQLSKLTAERDALKGDVASAMGATTGREQSLSKQLNAAKAEAATFAKQKALLDKSRAGLTKQLGDQLKEIAKLKTEIATERRRVVLPPQTESALKKFAQANEGFEFDPKTGVSKFGADILFDFGRAELKPQAQTLLKGFAAIFNTPVARALAIQIVGHTDNRPITKAGTLQKHPTNWHLSCHRAIGVLQHLRSAGIASERMEAAGRGEFDPVAPNDSDTNKQKNRRVEIFVVRRLAR